jgi:hypothetical protein
MKKIILTLVLLISVSIAGFSQYIILPKHGNAIEVEKVFKNEDTVKYITSSGQSGTIEISEILQIMDGNGNDVAINSLKTENEAKDQQPQKQYAKTPKAEVVVPNNKMKQANSNLLVAKDAKSIQTERIVAQEFRLGVIVGTNFSSFNWKDNKGNFKDDWDSETQDAHKQKLGLKLGVVGEYTFNDYFAISPELIFTQRGNKFKYKGTEDGESYKEKEKHTVNYFALPINVKGIIPISDDFKIWGMAGLYGSLALSGKYRESWKYKENGEITDKGRESEKFKFGQKDDEVKRIDCGLNFGVGVELSGFFVESEYNLGLSNLSNTSEDGYKISNRNFGISIGFML